MSNGIQNLNVFDEKEKEEGLVGDYVYITLSWYITDERSYLVIWSIICPHEMTEKCDIVKFYQIDRDYEDLIRECKNHSY